MTTLWNLGRPNSQELSTKREFEMLRELRLKNPEGFSNIIEKQPEAIREYISRTLPKLGKQHIEGLTTLIRQYFVYRYKKDRTPKRVRFLYHDSSSGLSKEDITARTDIT